MAFQKLESGGGAAEKIEKVKSITGHLIGVRWTPGKGKGKNKMRPSPIYQFQLKDKSRKDVWGCTDIDQNLLDGKRIKEEILEKLVRLTFKGRVKIPGRAQKMKRVLTEVDMTDSLNGKPYQLKRFKK